MKRTLLTLLCALLSLSSFADEGMWLPSLISTRIEDMRSKGFRLTAEDIYSINKASMKDAVVLFDGGCTGELVSDSGLLLTNHHCGFDAIQRLSSVDHDYLTNGFWAMSRAEELPAQPLNVRFLVHMDDVTARIAAGETPETIIAAAEKEGVGYHASIEQMYYGNQQFLFVYEQFDDVRLVGTPPSSIGRFGGDTDNWMWPRHTGDFSIFRIYADRNNRPAAYAADNVPYRPRRHFDVSTQGVAEGDFTMIYGFPGNTQQYVLSDAVEYVQQRSDPMKIELRTQRLNLLAQAQESSPALRIFYAARHANIANAWKKWQGEVLGLTRLKTAASKRGYEAKFAAWATTHPEYRNTVCDLKTEYKRIIPIYFARELLSETLRTLDMPYPEAERTDPLFAARRPTEQALYRLAIGEYIRRSSTDELIPTLRTALSNYPSAEAYADHLFAMAADDPQNTELAELSQAIAQQYGALTKSLGTNALRNLNSARLETCYKTYLKGLQAWDRQRAFFPDANLTLRVAYGAVQGYEYADGEYHKPQTTLDGIIAKDNPAIYDYDIPQALRDRYASKEYGRWGCTLNGHYTIPVCFLATNQTTGGNSGSPVLNGRGELVGINFDRTWRSTMSDMEFDPTICRNIAVDIRYVLFVVDRIGGAGWLLDEMTLR
ncbi:MAG: S46 family peptidase [Alistipes sp.]